jgi:hypothetical protein
LHPAKLARHFNAAAFFQNALRLFLSQSLDHAAHPLTAAPAGEMRLARLRGRLELLGLLVLFTPQFWKD